MDLTVLQEILPVQYFILESPARTALLTHKQGSRRRTKIAQKQAEKSFP